MFIRYFLYVRNFAKKFSLLGVEFFIYFFFANLRISIEYFDLLSSLCNSNIVWISIFCLLSTLEKILEPFSPSSSCLILAQSLALFACLFSNSISSFYKFSITGLIFGLKFSFCTSFIVFFWFWKNLIFSWVVEILEKNLVFSLKLDLLFLHQTIADDVAFYVSNEKKQILSWNCNILLSGGVFRKYLNILFKTRFGVFPPVTCWRVVVFYAFNKKRILCSSREIGLTWKRIIFLNLFHESFPILVFEGSLSIEIAL